MNPSVTLANYVREASSADNYRRLAARCGINSHQFEYVYRAAHPNKVTASGAKLSPVVHGNLSKLMLGLGLTFAPAPEARPTAAHIIEMIYRMRAPEDAKHVAAAAVRVAGELGKER
jgi:hypothetical protein